MIKNPHQKGTHANTPFCPGNNKGSARSVKYTTAGLINTLDPTKQTASSNFSFFVHRLSYNPNKNSATPTASVSAGRPQVLRLVKNGPRKVNTCGAGPPNQGRTPVTTHQANKSTTGKA